MAETASAPVRKTIPRTAAKKKRRNQLPIALIVLLLSIIGGLLLAIFISPDVGMFLLFGGCFGFILQKSRFCFTASMRDPCITGSTSVTKAVLIAFALTTIGFTAIKYSAFASGQTIPGMSYVQPVSLATVLGGILFGIGMVIAGGCASGTLMRVGEGFLMQMLSLLAMEPPARWDASARPTPRPR